MFCPTKDDLIPQALALLPRGRAWGTHEGGPGPETTLYKYWSAVCDVFAFACRRLCALRLEFWCATQSETRDLWMAEYGLPDECDPYPDLCAKVAAQGGARCEHLVSVAARAGWVIDCADATDACGDTADCAAADCAEAAGGPPLNTIVIRVDLGASDAYAGGIETAPFAGALVADGSLACDPDISPLHCVLDRIIHAHLAVEYILIQPPVYLMADDETHLVDEDGRLFVAE